VSGACRALSKDTLPRCRRVLGPDHSITRGAAAVLTGVLAGLGEVEGARALGEDTLSRCLRMLGPDHLITRSLAWVAVTDPHLRGGEAGADDSSSPR
jgi:Tetratricopeptide repeat